MKLARQVLVASLTVVAALTAAVSLSQAAPAAASSKAAPAPAAVRHFDNAVLHVEIAGRGRPMLFIPGLATAGDVYRDAVKHYAATYECHVVTLGGFGGQPRFEGPFLATARESLLAYVRTRHLDAPVIVGHSLGGVLALELAIAAPDAIGPVVVLDALPFLGGAGQPDATPASVRAQMEPMHKMIAGQSQAAYAAFQKQSPYLRTMVTSAADFERVLAWAVASDRIAVADGMLDVSTTDLREQVAAIRSPLLVLGTWYGLRAFTTRAAVEGNFRSQFAKAPNWSLATADSACHFVMLDAPEWTWSKIDTFLAASGTSRARAGGGQ